MTILEKIKYQLQNDPNSEDVCRMMLEKNGLLDYVIIDHELKKALSPGEQWLEQFVTVDPEMLNMKALAVKVANSPYETLITGETGTGKELIAKSMIGNRAGPIRSINCAGLPRELMEAELFGYVKGAFTGGKPGGSDGIILSAKDGLVFLDEIGELPLDMQAKLLRVIQNKEVRKVGGEKEEPISCKFVFATNKDIKKMALELETFRLDLYARISTLELDISPLRERICDIKPILESLPGGKEFLAWCKNPIEFLDISLNVRSLQRLVIRYQVLGVV